jgi:uncharacterized protein YndB with AHSA1/START domain
MIDVPGEIGGTHREVREGRVPTGEARTVLVRRTYPAPIEDVWDAITDASRISRWFLPVTGDFRLGGKYQLEGNAGGEILRCEPPRLLKVSWIYGDAEPGSSCPPPRTAGPSSSWNTARPSTRSCGASSARVRSAWGGTRACSG